MKHWIAVIVSAPLCACGFLEDDIARTHERTRSFDTPAAYMTADARIVTQRPHPVTGQPVVCVEPSPDAIKAISTAGAGGLKGGNGAVTAGIDLSGSSGEAAAELAGRSTALLGLREGLFRACEAYANGIIGGDAYGLILAKYAPTMTTLFLAQDITGASGVARSALAANAAPPGNGAPAAPASEDFRSKKATFFTPFGGESLARIWPVAAMVPDAHGQNNQKKSKPKKSTDKPDAATGASDASPSATAALALVRMNEDYMLQPTLISTLLVACIEQSDPTRLAFQKALTNTFLAGLCSQISSVDAILRYSHEAGELAWKLRLVEPTPIVKPSGGSAH